MAKNTTPSRPTPPKAHELPRKVDISVLDPARVAEIKAKAAAKMQARAIADAEDALLEQEMARLDREAHPETVHEMRHILLDLALYADRVTLDGKVFYPGESYDVPKPVYDVLMECAQATYRHDDEIHGDADQNFYRKSRAMSVNMRTGMATAGGAPLRF